MSAVAVKPAVLRGSTSPTLLMAAVVAAGLAVGIVTQVLQGVLPDGWGVLANSGVMWSLLAFALGSTMPTPRWAALGGAAQLVIASIVYYVAVDWFEGTASRPRSAVIWSIAGVVAGSVFGFAGWCFARRAGWRNPALALVSGVLIGEGLHLTWWVGNPDLRPAGVVELVIAAAIAAICFTRTRRLPRQGGAAIVATVIVAASVTTVVAMRVIEAVFGVT